MVGSKHTEIINNLAYNYQFHPIQFQDEAEVDIINNWMDPAALDGYVLIGRDNANGDEIVSSVYIPDGNVIVGGVDADEDGWSSIRNGADPAGEVPDEGTHRRLTRLSQPTYPAPLLTAAAAYEQVLKSAGARHRLDNNGSRVDNQDTLDARLVTEVNDDTGPGSLITDPSSETPPTVIPGTALTDTDGDGMSDDYEDNMGFDKADDTDGPTIAANGYSNVENFLNRVYEPLHGGPRRI
jgi:hypothetical protein